MELQMIALIVYILFFGMANVMIYTGVEYLKNEWVILVLEILSLAVMIFFIYAFGIEE